MKVRILREVEKDLASQDYSYQELAILDMAILPKSGDILRAENTTDTDSFGRINVINSLVMHLIWNYEDGELSSVEVVVA